MVDEEGKKKEDSFEFDSAGEAVEYISMDRARVVAMRAAREEPGNYGVSYEGVSMVFETVGQEEDEDYYHIRLSYHPAGRYIGEPGVEEFLIDKTGKVEFRQVLDVPEPAGSQSERAETAQREREEAAQREYVQAVQRERETARLERKTARREREEVVFVVFPDKKHEIVVRKELEKVVNYVVGFEGRLTRTDLSKLETLDAQEQFIRDLTGLDHATNLTTLYLRDNQISDFSPLASLTKLTLLNLNSNQTSDVSPLASLTNLTRLYLSENQINQESIDIHIPNLRSRGVRVEL